MITDLNKILVEWAYQVKNGKPNHKSTRDLIVLDSVLKDFGWNLVERNELVSNLTEVDIVKNKDSGNIYTVQNVNKDKHTLVKKNASEDDIEKIEKDKKTSKSPKEISKIMDGSQSSVALGLLYLNDKDKEMFESFKKDFIELEKNPSKELAQNMVEKYGLEVSSSGKKVYIRNINFEARKILGQTSGTLFIKNTLEKALGEPLKGGGKGVNVKQEVVTTSKPELQTKRTAEKDPNVKAIFSNPPYDRLKSSFHQIFGPVGEDGNILTPSSKNSKEYLKQSLNENTSVKRTIEKLKELEKTENVSPKIREALEKHQNNMENILNDYEVPSKEASEAVGNSYANMAEDINRESPTLASGMMKNLAEFALYDTEVAAGEECYLPSAGSFPSGDKLRVTRDGGKVERVASVSVKYGKSGKYGAYGFPGESGQYQKYHPNPEYRDRLHSRPGDDGYTMGVKDSIISSDKDMDKIIDESGLGDALSNPRGVKEVLRKFNNEIDKLKKEINYIQKPKRNSGIPPAKKQLELHKKRILELEKKLAKEMEAHVDRDKLNELVGKDNAQLMLSRPECMGTALVFASTLRTSNGLDVIEHNHQEIKDGKLISRTDTAKDGTIDIKNWKLGWRAWDNRGAGLIASFNSKRKEL